MSKRMLVAALFVLAIAAGLSADRDQKPASAQGQKPVLYVVSNSHLDTQWNWTVQDTIRDLIPATFRDNFKLFEQFPNYVFNFESAIHYMWFQEYHPGEWPQVKKYIDAGRWHLSGAWIVAADTHVPSPEALMRQALYGKLFFRQQFERIPTDVYLPDCFGFGFALPSTANHSGLRAFSTQKLSWGAPYPPPFAVGRWKGVDGSQVIAALRAGDYTSRLRSDVSIDAKWNGDLVDLGNGRKVGFRYFGVGDQGGAPDPESVQWLERAMANAKGAVQVRNTSADQLSKDLSEAEKAALPEYEGELLLKTHGVGCYTSQAVLKQWNRRNELLADAAERASVAAEWLGGPAYPRERLRNAWIRFLWHQFHDDLTGTSIPQAYLFSWNDQLLSLNEFAGTTTGAIGALSGALDTTAIGVPLVIYNPLAMSRRDLVVARVRFSGPGPAGVRVTDTRSGEVVPSQIVGRNGGLLDVVLLAETPSVGLAVYDVQPAPRGAAQSPAPAEFSGLSVTADTLQNERYTVKIDVNGDIASITDKEVGRNLLSAPIRLEMLDDLSTRWPAWEILWTEVQKTPRAYPGSPAVRIVERGPARVALEVSRKSEGSTFVQRISLAAGGDQVVVENDIDWKTPGTLLKAAFPLSASNQNATFDLGLGTVSRPNATDKAYEVPGQQWADITDASGGFGVAIFNDGKYGWDKPTDNTLRLTLIHTPKPAKGFVYQSSNDLGRHHFAFAIAGHAGDWRKGRVPARASRLNQPLMAFQPSAHAGALGRAFSMLTVAPDGDQVAVRALKKAEKGDEIVIRVQELFGQPASRVKLTLPVAAVSVGEINAAEEPLGPGPLEGGALVFDLARYQARSFAVKLGPSTPRIRPATTFTLDLPFTHDGLSEDADRRDGDFDGKGRTFPAELMPSRLVLDGVPFVIGSGAAGAKNVLVPAGQLIPLPTGAHQRLHLLASAIAGDTRAPFVFEKAGARVGWTTDLYVREWQGAIGQWSSRLADDRLLREVYVPPTKGQSWTLEAIQSQMVVRHLPDGTHLGFDRLRPPYVKRDDIALVATHRHNPQGNEPYIPGYVFRYTLTVPPGATALRLPASGTMRIFAITLASNDGGDTVSAGPLYAADIVATRPVAALTGPTGTGQPASEKPVWRARATRR